MSAPRLVVCGLEPGPAVALAAGALLAAFADERAVRPVLLGVDLPLWRLLYAASARAPRVLDPRLVDDAVAGELYDAWSADADLTAVVAVEPALDRWEGVKGSRPVDVAAALDAPLVLVVDARERGATAAAAACGVRMLARNVEFAGVIVVGGDDQGPASELRRILEETAKLPVLGWLPPQLSEQFARQYGGGGSSLRQIGPQPVKGGETALCREAGGYLDRDGLEAAAARRGFLPARPRRLLAPLPAAAGLTLAVAWGPPLEPFALEAIDLFKAMGLTLEPLHIGRDQTLPEGAAGLFLAGLLDEEELPAFAGNDALKASLAEAIAGGLPTLALGGGALLLLRRLADSRGRTPRAGRRPPGRGRTPRVVRASPLRARRRGPREPLRRGGDDPVRALRPRVPDPAAGGVRLARRRARRRGAGRGLRPRAVPGDDARAVPAGGAGPGRGLRRRDATGGAGRVSLAALETWLRTRRGLLALWLTTTVAVALVTLLMERGGVPGWDDAAHAYKVFLLRGGDSIFWDTYWYGGGYGAITYGFVFYWLAQYVSGALIVIVAAGTLPVTFYLYLRDMWKIDDVWPAWGFALVMALYLAHGQDPFVLALALTMGGLALLARRRPLWAALPVAIGIFANPMGLVVVVPFMLTDFIVRPGARRRYLLFAAALAPAVIVRVRARPRLLRARRLPQRDLAAHGVPGLRARRARAGRRERGAPAPAVRRPLPRLRGRAASARSSRRAARWATTSAASSWSSACRCSCCCATRGCGGRSATASSPSSPSCCSRCCSSAPRPATSSTPSSGRRPRARTSRPALAAARDLYDPDYRFHVVALRRHWEALYFPEAGYPITRGWYRQADAIHNGLFYTPYDAAEYVAWLQSMGVQYIFSPVDAPLDPWSKREARLLESSPAFAFVEQTGAWRIYRLRRREAAARPAAGDRGRRHRRHPLDRAPAHRLQRDAAGHVLAQGHVVAVLGPRGRAGDGAAAARPVHGPARWTQPARTRCASR